MISFGDSPVEEIWAGPIKVTEAWLGKDCLFKAGGDTVEFATAGEIDFNKKCPRDMVSSIAGDAMFAKVPGWYALAVSHGGRIKIQETVGNGTVIAEFSPTGLPWGVFLRRVDRLTPVFDKDASTPVSITAKYAPQDRDDRQTVVLDYGSEHCIQDAGNGTAAPSGVRRGVRLAPGEYLLSSNNGVYINGVWHKTAPATINATGYGTDIQLYYSGTRCWLIPISRP